MNPKRNKIKTPFGYIIRFFKEKAFEIKTVFLNLINTIDCPFDPEDNPFPQSCDKRIIHTEHCLNCVWRKGGFRNEKDSSI